MRRAAAEWIAAQRIAQRSIADLPTALRPASEDDGYAVQALVRDRLSIAGRGTAIGWKVGATTAAMQKLLGVPGPCAGEMLANGRRLDGVTLRADSFCRLGIECEIAMELGTELGADGPVDRASAARAVARIYPAAEIVDDRYGDFRSFGVPGLIADFFFHDGFVLGAPRDDWRGLALDTLVGTTSVNGGEKLRGRGADVLGHPLESLVFLANRLRAFGRHLRKGEIVMTGSLPLPHWAKAGETVVTQIEGLGDVTLKIA
jgi:2-oxo-3-hexenedioate decarboxylase/2-keto-4-pentenoate hydratase